MEEVPKDCRSGILRGEQWVKFVEQLLNPITSETTSWYGMRPLGS